MSVRPSAMEEEEETAAAAAAAARRLDARMLLAHHLPVFFRLGFCTASAEKGPFQVHAAMIQTGLHSFPFPSMHLREDSPIASARKAPSSSSSTAQALPSLLTPFHLYARNVLLLYPSFPLPLFSLSSEKAFPEGPSLPPSISLLI